jgi:hypothetical protein
MGKKEGLQRGRQKRNRQMNAAASRGRQRRQPYTSAHSAPTSPNVCTNISRAELSVSEASVYFFCCRRALPRLSCSWGLVAARTAPPAIAEDIRGAATKKVWVNIAFRGTRAWFASSGGKQLPTRAARASGAREGLCEFVRARKKHP